MRSIGIFYSLLITMMVFVGLSCSTTQCRLPPISSSYYTPNWSFNDPITISNPRSTNGPKYRVISGDRNYVVCATAIQDGAPVVLKKIVDEMPLEPEYQLWHAYVTNAMGGGALAIAASGKSGKGLLYLTYNVDKDSWTLTSDASKGSLIFSYNSLNGARRIQCRNVNMGIQYSPDTGDAVFVTKNTQELGTGWDTMYHFSFVMDNNTSNATNDISFDNSIYYNEDLYVNPTITSGTRFRLVTPDLKYVMLPFCSTLKVDSMDRTPVTPVQITNGRRPNPLEIFVFDKLTNYTFQEPSEYLYPPDSPWGVLTINPRTNSQDSGLFDLTLQMDSYVITDLSGYKPHNPSIGVPVTLVPLQEGYLALCSDSSRSATCYAYSKETNIIYLKTFSNCDQDIRWLPLQATDAVNLCNQ